MAKKAAVKGRADLPVSQDAQQRIPATKLKSSSLVDTRVVYCGDNLEQLAPLEKLLVSLVHRLSDLWGRPSLACQFLSCLFRIFFHDRLPAFTFISTRL